MAKYMIEETQLEQKIPKQPYRIVLKNLRDNNKEGSLLPASKSILVIRIRGENDNMCPTSRELLYSLRLWKLNTGVFVKPDESIMAILQKLGPFVTYGYPPLKTVKDLIYRGTTIELDNQITELNDNNAVEQAFGQYNISGFEDIVNEISNIGSHFDHVSRALCPFPLRTGKKELKGNEKRHNDGQRDTVNARVLSKEKQLERMIQKKNFRLHIKPCDKEGSLSTESKPIFIMRIAGEDDMCPTSRELLYSLRLWKLNTAVFVKADERIMAILQKLEPFVTYGYPSPNTVKGLIYRSGAIELDKQITKLKDTNVVEQAFGQYNIVCIEDIVNEITNVGSHFDEVSKALCPFKLRKGNKASLGKRKREEHVNELISKFKKSSLC